MAKLTAPLMSFGASGKLGGSLVFSQWKGVPTARQYIIPANPQTVGQVAQRNLMKSCVNAWRRPAVSAAIRTAWNLLASLKTAAMSGFNAFTSNLVKLAAEDPDASYVVAIASTILSDVTLTMQNLDDGATGDEAGNFAILFGDSSTNLVNSATGAIAAGVLTFDATAGGFAEGDTIFVSVRKAGTGTDVYDRAGIIEMVLTA